MKVVSACQGSSLDVFLKLLELLEAKQKVSEVGVYVSDSMSYDKISSGNKRLEESNVSIIKEWEVYREGVSTPPDWEVLKKFEAEVTDSVLWHAILSDRRVIFGKHCKMRQHYKSRFSYDEMHGILQVALVNISNLFDEIEPNLVISFGTSNIGDYLFYLMAKARKIPFLQLKSTKISNRVSFNDDIILQSKHILEVYNDNNTVFDADITREAEAYIKKVEKTGVQYEGAILHKRKVKLIDIVKSLAKGLYTDIRKYLNPVYRVDNHLEPYFLLQLHEKLFNPLRFHFQSLVLRKSILSYDQLDDIGEFIFFPLHFEPEVSMQVFGRPYQNQIELIRHIALSAPVGFKVVVKEHPRSKGFRSLKYYKKILEVPNVHLMKTEISTNLVSKKAALVAMISGSTGLEAAIIGKPVITFGTPVYNVLSDAMVKHVTDLNRLPEDIKTILTFYKKNEDELKHFICSVIYGSAPVNLYTTLLKKEGRYRGSHDADDKVDSMKHDYKRLADYFSSRIEYELGRMQN